MLHLQPVHRSKAPRLALPRNGRRDVLLGKSCDALCAKGFPEALADYLSPERQQLGAPWDIEEEPYPRPSCDTPYVMATVGRRLILKV